MRVVNFSICSTVILRVQGLHLWIGLGLRVRDRVNNMGLWLGIGFMVKDIWFRKSVMDRVVHHFSKYHIPKYLRPYLDLDQYLTNM